ECTLELYWPAAARPSIRIPLPYTTLFRSAFAKVLDHRNVILVDQRGTGGSNPLKCDFGDNALALETPEAARAATERCRDELSKQDRKSTRLNSSHVKISYAVFCLKKKKQT